MGTNLDSTADIPRPRFGLAAGLVTATSARSAQPCPTSPPQQKFMDANYFGAVGALSEILEHRWRGSDCHDLG